MTVKKVAFYFLFLLLSFVQLQAQEQLPTLKARVTDMTQTLSAAEVSTLENKLRLVEEEKGSQLVVVIIPTTGDETIEQYSIRLADQWKIGRADVDDGVILLIAKNDRKMRIEVGYGLEGAIPDAIAKRIISQIITPEFRAGHFYKGIDLAMDAIIQAVRGEELPPAIAGSGNSRTAQPNGDGLLVFILIAYVFTVLIMRTILDRKVGKKRSKFFTTLIMFIILLILADWFVAIFVSIITLIFTSASVGQSAAGRRSGGWYVGGGGFSGGGGGFGGFSGGGGGFGGGGASGGW